MATHFERQLEALHVQIITMGSFCEKAISLSNKAPPAAGSKRFTRGFRSTENDL